MEWTADKPKCAGWFWVRKFPVVHGRSMTTYQAEAVELQFELTDKENVAGIDVTPFVFSVGVEDGAPLSTFNEYEWYGPLEVPK